MIHDNFDQLILWCQNCARKSVESKKSHGDHKAIEHDLENRLAVLPISSNILKYRISKNSVISCFQVLKSVSESKSNSWFHGVHLYDSTFNWKGLEALTKNLTETTKVLAIRNMLKLFHSLISLVGCIRKGLGPQTIWNEKGFSRSIHFRIKIYTNVSKTQSRLSSTSDFDAPIQRHFFSAFFGCQPAKT